MIERQELYCHECNNYVQFDVDVSLNGNHVFNCPKCGHEHCRVVKDGKITDIRFDSRNGNTYWITGITTSATSTYDVYSVNSATNSIHLYQSWMNSSTSVTS